MNTKKISLCLIGLVLLTALVADNETLERIGSSMDKIKESSFYAIQQDQFNLFSGGYDVGLCKKIPTAERAAVVTAVGQVIKKYAMSTAFTADYEKKVKEEYSNRESKPNFSDPQWQEKIKEKEGSSAQMVNMLDDNTLKGIFDGAVSMNKMINDAFESNDPNKVAAFSGAGLTAEESKANTKELNALEVLFKSDKKEFKKGFANYMAKAEVKNQFNSELSSYNNSISEMNKKLALNKNDQLKKILKSFLDASADIDFNAKLLPPDKYGIQKFANADYESKSSDWKAYYRVGKAPVEAARSFAKQWLSELH